MFVYSLMFPKRVCERDKQNDIPSMLIPTAGWIFFSYIVLYGFVITMHPIVATERIDENYPVK